MSRQKARRMQGCGWRCRVFVGQSVFALVLFYGFVLRCSLFFFHPFTRAHFARLIALSHPHRLPEYRLIHIHLFDMHSFRTFSQT